MPSIATQLRLALSQAWDGNSIQIGHPLNLVTDLQQPEATFTSANEGKDPSSQ